MAPSPVSPTLREYRHKRDFSRTPEPSGVLGGGTESHRDLEFVVQKHAASHLHFDLRLELGGVMKSWAVPKGPSLDPAVKRLAVEVEDHPMEYNAFEGNIPAGEYGGGTMMLWDRGTYDPDNLHEGEDPEKALRCGYQKGKLAFTLHGERLRGSFALVHTGRAEAGGNKKPQWLLIKHADEWADPGGDEVGEGSTSVTTGRTMEEIAAGKGVRRVWRSNRTERPRVLSHGRGGAKASSPAVTGAFSPMLCQTAPDLPEGDGWTFEPKYDGIRVLAYVTSEAVSLVTRNGKDKSGQFPELAAALQRHAAELKMPLVLDGEIVGLDERGDPLRFESLQERMHVTDPGAIQRHAEQRPVGFVAFDLLLAGEAILVPKPWSERRGRLEELLSEHTGPSLRIAEAAPDGEAMLRRAERGDWEGLVAKRTDARYKPGERTSDWLKIKLENRQEFVIGGWTEPRGSRPHLGALLLGYYTGEGELVYAGHTGAGFTQQELSKLHRQLKRLERKTPPFRQKPKTNQPAHWTTPKLVAEIRFNEWTREGKLRQPVFLGIRRDKDPRTVVRESAAGPPDPLPRKQGARGAATPVTGAAAPNPLVRRIREIETDAGEGEVTLDRGTPLALTSLKKVFYPRERYTKADLLAFYAGMADHILPWMDDRPLVLKRFPNGIEGESFYQQASPEEVPDGLRVEMVQLREENEPKARLVGGTLATLLYTVQLGAISYDPWHSRVGHLDTADYTILDLDPGPGASFQQVVRVARWVKEELDAFALHGALKTSGSRGIHIYLPLPPNTPLEAATLVAQIVATRVAQRHPGEATIERMKKNRPRGTVYVDYLQNILGKTVAGVYAARAKPGAPVSTPLGWHELTDDLDLRAFTIQTVPERVREIGDLWASAMQTPNSLDALLGGAGA